MKSRTKKTRKTAARKPARRKKAAAAAKGRGRRTPAKARGRRTPARGARKTAAKVRRPGKAAKRADSKQRARKPAAKKRTGAASPKTTRRAPAAASSVERPRARREPVGRRGLGSEAAGQAGDTEAISRAESVDSESVEELLEEGQSWEAGIVSGVENADDEEGEVHTHEVPQDDVPEEYRDEEEPGA